MGHIWVNDNQQGLDLYCAFLFKLIQQTTNLDERRVVICTIQDQIHNFSNYILDRRSVVPDTIQDQDQIHHLSNYILNSSIPYSCIGVNELGAALSISIEVISPPLRDFEITFRTLSGTGIEFKINKSCTVGDVASRILQLLNRQKQEKGEEPVEYIHLVLGDKKFVPWDHDKPLSEFLT